MARIYIDAIQRRPADRTARLLSGAFAFGVAAFAVGGVSCVCLGLSAVAPVVSHAARPEVAAAAGVAKIATKADDFADAVVGKVVAIPLAPPPATAPTVPVAPRRVASRLRSPDAAVPALGYAEHVDTMATARAIRAIDRVVGAPRVSRTGARRP